jgi:MFS superfamily sulfate permease-like transporter
VIGRIKAAIARIPAPVRHAILAALSVAAAAVWEAWRNGEATDPSGLVAVAVAAVLAWATPLVQSYGLGRVRPVTDR